LAVERTLDLSCASVVAPSLSVVVRSWRLVIDTERGRLVALLTPPEPGRTARERLLAAGRLLPPANPSGRLRGPQPVPISPGQPTNQELLDAERGERL
jgi:antitoxin (DNA-binding transcriptional repressor) of toxin-antitoxin stability system